MITLKRVHLTVLLFSTIAWTQLSLAESYVGVQFGVSEYETNQSTGEFDQATFNARIGTHASHYLAGELRYGIGTDGEDGAELDSYYAAYLKGITPTGTFFEPYFLMGYTRTTMITRLSEESQYRISAWSFGLGGDFDLTDKVKLSLEYLRPFDHDSEQMTGV